MSNNCSQATEEEKHQYEMQMEAEAQAKAEAELLLLLQILGIITIVSIIGVAITNLAVELILPLFWL